MKDPAYPWQGNPRRFLAIAMPNGDRRFGIEGELVFLSEKRGHCRDRLKFLSRAEAEQLRDEINAALRAFDAAKEMATAIACRAPYPFRDHRTLAEVDDLEGAR